MVSLQLMLARKRLHRIEIRLFRSNILVNSKKIQSTIQIVVLAAAVRGESMHDDNFVEAKRHALAQVEIVLVLHQVQLRFLKTNK